jgi:hypothetical protein
MFLDSEYRLHLRYSALQFSNVVSPKETLNGDFTVISLILLDILQSIRRRVSGLTDDDSYKDDEDSYVRTTDDDDGGGTDWEEAMKRWVNR